MRQTENSLPHFIYLSFQATVPATDIVLQSTLLSV
jgi:hypothetical protein